MACWIHRLFAKLLVFAILSACALIVIQAYVLECFLVPTESMAPSLLGHHRELTCPCCGLEFAVGRARSDQDGGGGARHYEKCFCPNCGCRELYVGELQEISGDQILADKLSFQLRDPRRWEVVVFRRGGRYIIKRIVGLAGEWVVVADGDVYVNGELARKTWQEARALGILLFDQDHQPPQGWGERWEGPAAAVSGNALILDGRGSPCRLTYRNFNFETQKCEPLLDEYAYNAGLHAHAEPVHDFMVEFDLAIQEGEGRFELALNDGAEWVRVTVPVAQPGSVTAMTASSDLGQSKHMMVLQRAMTYHVEAGLVDRRLTIRVDGLVLLERDLPAPIARSSVTHPCQLTADGVTVEARHLRLYRDLHYRQDGRQGVRGRNAHLADDEYFVLGDNSPNSEDSRFWTDGGVPRSSLVGRIWLHHWPSKAAALDWSRLGIVR